MPRQLDSVWNYFEKVVQIGKTGCRAKCKRCSKDIQGIVARMKCHVDICSAHWVYYDIPHIYLFSELHIISYKICREC